MCIYDFTFKLLESLCIERVYPAHSTCITEQVAQNTHITEHINYSDRPCVSQNTWILAKTYASQNTYIHRTHAPQALYIHSMDVLFTKVMHYSPNTCITDIVHSQYGCPIHKRYALFSKYASQTLYIYSDVLFTKVCIIHQIHASQALYIHSMDVLFTKCMHYSPNTCITEHVHHSQMTHISHRICAWAANHYAFGILYHTWGDCIRLSCLWWNHYAKNVNEIEWSFSCLYVCMQGKRESLSATSIFLWLCHSQSVFALQRSRPIVVLG